MSKETNHYLVLPKGQYQDIKIAKETGNLLTGNEMNHMFIHNVGIEFKGKIDKDNNFFVYDITAGLEKLIADNPLNDEIFGNWVYRFDYLALLLQSCGLERYLPYIVRDIDPCYASYVGSGEVTLIKV